MKKGKKDFKPVVEVTDKLPPWKPGTQKPPCEKKEPKVELVYDPSIAEEYRREQAAKAEKPISYEDVMQEINTRDQLEVCAVRSRVLKDGYYRKNTAGNAMILEGLSMQDDHLGLNARNWIRLSEEIRQALEQLGIREETWA